MQTMELLEVLTVGLPFCGFKLLSGGLFWGFSDMPVVHDLGAALIALGAVDFFMNAVNFLSLLVWRRRALRTCLFDALMRPEWTWHDLGNSLDVLLSFTLVAIVIGGSFLKQMSPQAVSVWSLCVVFNVMGAGLGRLGNSLISRRPGLESPSTRAKPRD